MIFHFFSHHGETHLESDMHLSAPRIPFRLGGLVQMPASVTPVVRFPLFWLSLHHLPQWLYRALVRRVVNHDGLLVTYFHPWEFSEDTVSPQYRLPFVVRRHCGQPMVNRLDGLISNLLHPGYHFTTFSKYININNIYNL